MTRIIAGDFGGRRLRVPSDGTRPTSDRVREAIFSIISARAELSGARVLDLYAGSGALGLEAVSRGAAYAVFVEMRRAVSAVIAANATTCGCTDRTSVVTRSVAAYLTDMHSADYDFVFLDPPYDLDEAAMSADLQAVADRVLAADGIVVVERSARSAPTKWPPGLEMLAGKTYGDTRVEVAEFVGTSHSSGGRFA